MASKKKNKKKNQTEQLPKEPEQVSEILKEELPAEEEEDIEDILEEMLPTVEEDPDGDIEIFDFSDIPDVPTARNIAESEDDEMESELVLKPEEKEHGASILMAAVPVAGDEPDICSESEENSTEPEQSRKPDENPDENKEESNRGVNAISLKKPAGGLINNPMIRSAAVFAGILAAAGLIVSTIHVLTDGAAHRNAETALHTAFVQLFPDASVMREYSSADGMSVWLAVNDGEISGYCVEENGELIGYTVEGEPFGALQIGTGETADLPTDGYVLDLSDAAADLGLTLLPEETEEPSANADNGSEEIVIGEAVEEGSETADSAMPERTEETEETDDTVIPAETEPETQPAPETEPAEPDVPVVAEPEPQLPDVPVAAETSLETEPETEPVETESETWWTPETESVETQPDTEADIGSQETDTSAETEPTDSDMTESDTEPEETSESPENEEVPEISVEIEVEIPDPAETEPEETEAETEETQKKETKRSGSGLF